MKLHTRDYRGNAHDLKFNTKSFLETEMLRWVLLLQSLQAFPSVLVSLIKNKTFRAVLQNDLVIDVLGWGQALQHSFWLRPQRSRYCPWLWTSTLPGPQSASTIPVLIVQWHCQHFGSDLVLPFWPFLLLALIFTSTFFLCPCWIRLLEI